MKRFLRLWSALVMVGCGSTTALNIPEQNMYSISFDSTYYHVLINRGGLQTIYPISATTNVPETEKVIWESDTFWTAPNRAMPGVLDTIPTVNSFSYPYQSMVRSVFAPTRSMIGDTATIVVWTRMNSVTYADTAYFVMY